LQSDISSALLKNYSRYKVEFVRGKGAYLYDNSGKEYLDFLSGIAVTGFGHRHPAILKAAKEQLEKIWHTSNLFQSSGQESLANKLAELSGLDNVFFCNSGTEANEAAIKFVRKWGKGRSTIITALGGFHGRTLGSLSATGQYKLWEGFFPLTPGFMYVPFDDIEAIEYSINHDTAAIMIEPIQGETGIIVPSENYLRKLREICDKNNLLLVIDEVQTGMGRTGKMFAYQWEEIKPDIITVAKGIANGLPLGATICTKVVAECITPGSHGSTFGGNPVAIAAANVVMDLHTEDQLAYTFAVGEKLKDEIKNLSYQLIKEIRGKGLMIGVEFHESVNAKDVALKLLEEGVVVGTSGEKVIRILPPFIITEEDTTKFILIFSSVLNKLRNNNADKIKKTKQN
jgi:predicted acetylornithine/succinylornithine family transaminase